MNIPNVNDINQTKIIKSTRNVYVILNPQTANKITNI